MEINLKQALDIFEENIPEIKQGAITNRDHELNFINKPNIADCQTFDHWWVKANTYQIKRELIIDKYKPVIRHSSLRTQPKKEGDITEVDIEKAKDYPISELLNVQGRKGNISCPFHKDRTPSFQIKKNNTFTCYSCGRYGDSIDLYSELNNVGFLEAVKALT